MSNKTPQQPEQNPNSTAEQNGSAVPLHGFADQAKNEEVSTAKAMGDGYGLGIHFIVCILVGGAAGYFLDQWLGTLPWFMLLMFFLGFGAGLWQIIKKLS